MLYDTLAIVATIKGGTALAVLVYIYTKHQ